MSSPHACLKCLRRTWLLGLAAPYIEKTLSSSPATSVPGVLRLGNEDLVELVAHQTGLRLLARVEAMLEGNFEQDLQASSCWAVCRHDDLYPDSLRDATDAPWALVGRGDTARLADFDWSETVTIAGARRATTYGREVARTLGHDLAAAGITVTSGLAFGVDACAHRGALESGRTIAILGCGPDIAYPATHRSLWRRICEGGLVISELPPGTGAWRWTFLARNRIMAALAGMTVLIEASERSGSMVTADFARALGRELGAVPGPVTSRISAGPNSLLAGGAHVVRNTQDVLNVLGGKSRKPGRVPDRPSTRP